MPVVWLALLLELVSKSTRLCAWCGLYLYGMLVSFCRHCDMFEELDGFLSFERYARAALKDGGQDMS